MKEGGLRRRLQRTFLPDSSGLTYRTNAVVRETLNFPQRADLLDTLVYTAHWFGPALPKGADLSSGECCLGSRVTASGGFRYHTIPRKFPPEDKSPSVVIPLQ